MLAARAVTAVAAAGSFWAVLLVTQMSGQLRLKRPFYDGLRQLLQKTVLSSYVLRRLARRKQLVDQILLLLHTISCLSGMIVYTKLFTPSVQIELRLVESRNSPD